MSHQVENLEIHEADKQILSVTIQDPDSVLGDITGAALQWGLYGSTLSPAAFVTKNTGGSELVIVDGPNRVVEINLDEGDTDGILSSGIKFFYHELRIENSPGDPLTVMTGRVDIVRSKVRLP